MTRYTFPLDPSCPPVRAHNRAVNDDPYSSSIPSDVMGDVQQDFASKHRAHCKRCQEYGAANVEADY